MLLHTNRLESSPSMAICRPLERVDNENFYAFVDLLGQQASRLTGAALLPVDTIYLPLVTYRTLATRGVYPNGIEKTDSRMHRVVDDIADRLPESRWLPQHTRAEQLQTFNQTGSNKTRQASLKIAFHDAAISQELISMAWVMNELGDGDYQEVDTKRRRNPLLEVVKMDGMMQAADSYRLRLQFNEFLGQACLMMTLGPLEVVYAKT